jgi:hypothetical protein
VIFNGRFRPVSKAKGIRSTDCFRFVLSSSAKMPDQLYSSPQRVTLVPFILGPFRSSDSQSDDRPTRRGGYGRKWGGGGSSSYQRISVDREGKQLRVCPTPTIIS